MRYSPQKKLFHGFLSIRYSVCVRPERGFCCVRYQVQDSTIPFKIQSLSNPAPSIQACSDANSFTLDANQLTGGRAEVDDQCVNQDYIGINGISKF